MTVTGSYLAGKGRYVLQQIVRRIWFRASLFSLAAIAAALIAAWIAPYIPTELSLAVGGKAVDNILGIVASSMLAVTTFALSSMVTAYGTATNSVTPRATQLLVEDGFTQNALSTFVGTFLFAIVGIIALTTGIYGANGRVVLFFATIIVVAVIAITLLRWIQHLSKFGRMQDTIARVERVAVGAAAAWAEAPRIGAQPPVPLPAGARPVFAAATGYIQHIDVGGLSRLARRHDATIHIASLPGMFVHAHRPIAHVAGPTDEAMRRKIAKAFTVQPDRNYEQDPRFGLIVLGEIASRALSPAVNDPGTAIRVLGSGHRVLAALATTPAAKDASCHRGVHAPDLVLDDLFEDFFRPIARDGAGTIEVQLRLQATLAALIELAPDRYGAPARTRARDALVRAQAALDDPADIAAVSRACPADRPLLPGP